MPRAVTSTTTPSCWRMRSLAWRMAKLLSIAKPMAVLRSSSVGMGGTGFSGARAKLGGTMAQKDAASARANKTGKRTGFIKLLGRQDRGEGRSRHRCRNAVLGVVLGDEDVERRNDEK